MFLLVHNGLLTVGRKHHVYTENYKGKVGRINFPFVDRSIGRIKFHRGVEFNFASEKKYF